MKHDVSHGETAADLFCLVSALWTPCVLYARWPSYTLNTARNNWKCIFLAVATATHKVGFIVGFTPVCQCFVPLGL